MKNKPFHCTLGATTACAVCMAQGTCQSAFDNRVEIVKGDSWFGSVNTVVKIKNICPQEKEAIFSVKTVHKLFPKQFIEETLKEEPEGSSIKLKSEVEGVKLIAICYKYHKKHTLHFIMSENAGSTACDEPYQMKFSDDNGNVHVRNAPHPEVISDYFKESNCVDIVHNQLQQNAVKLEKMGNL
jgi:hypothetical protein